MNTIYRNYSFLQTMEIVLGDKLEYRRNLDWIIEIDAALGTLLRSLPVIRYYIILPRKICVFR